MPNVPHYVAAKVAVIGLTRALALEPAPDLISVNTIHPAIADTPMVHNEAAYKLLIPRLHAPTPDQAAENLAALDPMYTPWIEAEEVGRCGAVPGLG